MGMLRMWDDLQHERVATQLRMRINVQYRYSILFVKSCVVEDAGRDSTECVNVTAFVQSYFAGNRSATRLPGMRTDSGKLLVVSFPHHPVDVALFQERAPVSVRMILPLRPPNS